MYSEKTFKNYIFWIQVKRVFVIIVLSILGATLGVLVGKLLESIIQSSFYNNYIIIGLTVLFFIISLLLTSNTGKEVQDAYWKIAVLRKLTVIQKNLEFNNELLSNNNNSLNKYKSHSKKIDEDLLGDIQLEKNDNIALIKREKTKLKTKKAIKKPEKIN